MAVPLGRYTRDSGQPRRAGQHRGRSGGMLEVGKVQTLVLAIIVFLIVSSYILFPPFSEPRWTLFVLLLMAIAWIISTLVFRGAGPLPLLGLPQDRNAKTNPELERLLGMLDRAERGMRYSRATLLQRARDAFIRKMAALRGVPIEDIEDELADEWRIQKAVKDPRIVSFLTSSSREDFVMEDFQGKAFTEELGRVLESMEEWG